jgi:hypothetical protein
VVEGSRGSLKSDGDAEQIDSRLSAAPSMSVRQGEAPDRWQTERTACIGLETSTRIGFRPRSANG